MVKYQIAATGRHRLSALTNDTFIIYFFYLYSKTQFVLSKGITPLGTPSLSAWAGW
jgi:hypothetical protein